MACPREYPVHCCILLPTLACNLHLFMSLAAHTATWVTMHSAKKIRFAALRSWRVRTFALCRVVESREASDMQALMYFGTSCANNRFDASRCFARPNEWCDVELVDTHVQ